MLRAQVEVATVVRREWSGCGVFTHFAVPETAPRIPASVHVLGGEIAGFLPTEREPFCCFVLFVRNGRLDMLEAAAFGDDWIDDEERLIIRG